MYSDFTYREQISIVADHIDDDSYLIVGVDEGSRVRIVYMRAGEKNRTEAGSNVLPSHLIHI